jgi:membrane protease YdiL (CAAX protease family)
MMQQSMRLSMQPRLGLSPLAWGLVLVVVFSVLRAGFGLGLQQFFGGSFEPTPAFLVAFVLAFLVLSVGFIVGGLRWLGGVSWHDLGWKREGLLKSFGLGILGGVLLVVVTMAGGFAMLALAGGEPPPTPPMPSPGQLLMSFLWGFLFAAWQEENLFRGYLQPLLIERWGYWPGIGAQAALYSLAHIGYHTMLPLFALTFAIGLVLGVLRGRNGNLVAPFLAHGLIG